MLRANLPLLRVTVPLTVTHWLLVFFWNATCWSAALGLTDPEKRIFLPRLTRRLLTFELT